MKAKDFVTMKLKSVQQQLSQQTKNEQCHQMFVSAVGHCVSAPGESALQNDEHMPRQERDLLARPEQKIRVQASASPALNDISNAQ